MRIFNGEPLTPLKTLAQATIHPDKFDWSKDHNINFDIKEGFEIEKIVEGGRGLMQYLHYSPQEGLLTKAEEFIVRIDPEKKKLIEVNGIPGMYYYVPVNDTYFYALRLLQLQRSYTLAKYSNSTWEFTPVITKMFTKILVHPSGEVFVLTNPILGDDNYFRDPSSLINMDKNTTVELENKFDHICCTASETFVGLNSIGRKNNIIEFTKEGITLKSIEISNSVGEIRGISTAGEREVYVISNKQIILMNLDTFEMETVLTFQNQGSKVMQITQKSNSESYFSISILNNKPNSVFSNKPNISKGIIFKLKRK